MVAVGPGHPNEPITDVKVGDVVFVESFPQRVSLREMFIHNRYWYISARISSIIGVATKEHVKNCVNKNIILSKAVINP